MKKSQTIPLSTEVVDESTIEQDASTILTVSKTVRNSKKLSSSIKRPGQSFGWSQSVSVRPPQSDVNSKSFGHSYSYKQSETFNSGEEKTEEKTISKQYTCPGIAGKRTECRAIVQMQRVTIPYTLTWQKITEPDCVCRENGKYSDEFASSTIEIDSFDM